MQFSEAKNSDEFSAGLSGSYSGWGVSVSAAASYAKKNDAAKKGAQFEARRDVLPIGFQVRLEVLCWCDERSLVDMLRNLKMFCEEPYTSTHCRVEVLSCSGPTQTTPLFDAFPCLFQIAG